jgi:hypothetical protein
MQLVTACLCCDTSSWRTVTYSIVHLKSWKLLTIESRMANGTCQLTKHGGTRANLSFAMSHGPDRIQ